MKPLKVLVIGDAHLRVNLFEYAFGFVNQIITLIKKGNYDLVILLGDQFDSFAVVRSEILSVWTHFFREASALTKVVALVGNHDLAGVDGGAHPMEAFKQYSNVTIVDSPLERLPSVDLPLRLAFFPFFRSNEEFERAARLLPSRTILFCHQSFNGATFENGFYDPHGADPACVEHLIGTISGHVHKAQFVGDQIWYPGTPFQHTFSDAGEEKFVYELSVSETGYSKVNQIKLEMPEFAVIERANIGELTEAVQLTQAKNLTAYKFLAQGSPSEIAQFWQEPVVKAFKQSARRVVDALTSQKPTQKFVSVNAKTQKEKLYEYIQSKEWRTERERLIFRAEELLAN